MSKSTDDQLEEILQAIKDQQDSIDGLTKSVSHQQDSIDGLTKSVSLQQNELAGLREEMREGFNELRDEQHKQGATLESIQDNLKLIVEATSPEFEKRTEIEQKISDHDNELVQHTIRLNKLEAA